MQRKRLISAVFACLCCAASPLVARQESGSPVFKARSDLVVLYVNVFNGRSKTVPHLPQSAFRIEENGTPQEISFFSDADIPVAVGLVIDNSSSMLTRRNMVVAGTRAFVGSSHPEDEVFTIIFNEHVRRGLPAGVRFTQSQSLVHAGLLRYPPGGMTALYDAVIEGIDHLGASQHESRVLVVLSDGDDNASRRSKDEMFQRIANSNTLIYTISTADVGSSGGDPGLLKKMASESGGLAYSPHREQDVVNAFREVADTIRSGYRIGYAPATRSGNAGAYRRVKVTAHMPGYKDLKVHTRQGYADGHRAAQ